MTTNVSGSPTIPVSRVSAAALLRRIDVPDAAEHARSAYRDLAGRIRSALVDGRLSLHTTLPSERELAVTSKLSRSTVAAAYALLRDEGWLQSRRGSGSRLQFPPDGAPSGAMGAWLPTDAAPAGIIDLTTACLPAPEQPLMAAIARATAELPRHVGADGYHPLGLLELRTVIADRYTRAGAPTSPSQILITNGAQHAWSLVLAELSAPGDRILQESPTYPLALDAIRAQRRTPVPFALLQADDRSGPWDVDLLSTALRQSAPRLAYLIPDFQNPTGALMDGDTRQAVVRAARATSTTVVVDESLRDVPFDPASMPAPMSALDTRGRVITIGSVSKSLWGGLRVGWARGPADLITRLAHSRSLGDMAGPVLDQLIVAELLADPEEAFGIQRRRLETRCAALQLALTEHLPHWRWTRPSGGATLWVQLPAPYATELGRLAPTGGVQIVPGPRFGPDGTMDSFLRLPFTQPAEQLETAVRRLAAVELQARRTRPAVLDRWLT